MNTENPDKLIKDAMKIEFFFVSFCNTYFAKKKSTIEAKAAKKIIRSIEKKARFTIIPFPMNIIGRIIRVLPCFLWDCLARNAPRKKRVSNKS